MDVHLSKDKKVSIYLSPFHSSYKGYGARVCSAAYKPLSDALGRGEWPYDVGDDPAFFSRQYFGGNLTWGICRQQIRNKLQPGDIVVFFAFRKRGKDEPTEYSFCSIATIKQKVTQSAIWKERSLKLYRRYLNLLVRPGSDGIWKHDERGNSPNKWHKDWLWRSVYHDGLRKRDFELIQKNDQFSVSKRLRGSAIEFAPNYVIFSENSNETIVLKRPPVVARSKRSGQPERWLTDSLSRAIKKRTVDTARKFGKRGNLRTRNLQRAHPVIRWRMSDDDAVEWRTEFIRLIRELRA